MARIRTIKPEFFTSDDVVALTPWARLLYIALWCEADREGRLQWKPGTFKRRYFPDDNINIDQVAGELLGQGLVVPYGDGLAFIPKFSKHQHVNPRESKSELPPPLGWSPDHPTGPARGAIRSAILERDGHRCVRCGATETLEIDHILPQSLGGPTIADNLRALCKTCNAGRPVAGEALEADLRRDGFTISGLIERFSRVTTRHDASNLDLHTQGGREGKEGKGTKEAQSADPAGSSPPEPDGLGIPAPLAPPDDSSAGRPRAADVDPVKAIFDLGIPILTAAGHSERAARSLIGRLRKLKGDEQAASVLVAAKSKTDPATYIAAATLPEKRRVQLC